MSKTMRKRRQVMKAKMGKAIANVLRKIVSEETLTSILLVLGDWIVGLSSNKLDNKVWAQVKKALAKK
jgi:hypothetical protein